MYFFRNMVFLLLFNFLNYNNKNNFKLYHYFYIVNFSYTILEENIYIIKIKFNCTLFFKRYFEIFSTCIK